MASTPSQHSVINETVHNSLYRATITGDWEKLNGLLKDNSEAIRTTITHNSGTVLHLAIATNQKESFLRNLLAFRTSLNVLRMTTNEEDTALHHAASFGNLEGAKLLVEADRELLYLKNSSSLPPLVEAAKSAQREVFTYLLNSMSFPQSSFEGNQGTMIVENLVTHGFCDLALDFMKRFTVSTDTIHRSLHSIACRPSNFLSGAHYTLLEETVYKVACIWGFCENSLHHSPLERRRNEASFNILTLVKTVAMGGILFVISLIRRMKADKKLHGDSIDFVKFTCTKLQWMNKPQESKVTYQIAGKIAARNGTYEVIEEIMVACPTALFLENDDPEIGIFHIAVKHRQHQVFNLIFQMSFHRDALLTQKDKNGNTILHIAATLPSSDRLNLAHGAALQMQREILWYKAVEEAVPAWIRNVPNEDPGIEPRNMFTEEHKKLVKEGETWMRETAKSCTTAATLIIGMTFAAAISVPGGTDIGTKFIDHNSPIISKQLGIIFFVISDATSLLLSVTSLLMFLSLLTARYREQDFLKSLPTVLIVALFTLIFSIFFLMITFGTIIYLVYSPGERWIWVLLVLLFCLPVWSFYLRRLPSLIGMLWNILFAEKAIFHKQGKRLLF